MTREDQLKLCSVCKNRKIDDKRGLLCSLTDEYVDTEVECLNFSQDEAESEKLEQENSEFYSKEDLRNDLIFCLMFSFFASRGRGIHVFMIALCIVVLSFVLSNCLLIQYEKKKGEKISLGMKSILKDIFAVLITFLFIFEL